MGPIERELRTAPVGKWANTEAFWWLTKLYLSRDLQKRRVYAFVRDTCANNGDGSIWDARCEGRLGSVLKDAVLRAQSEGL